MTTAAWGWRVVKTVPVVVVSAAAAYLLAVWLQEPPVAFVAVREVDKVVASGGTLRLLFDLRRQRVCPVRVERQLWRWVVLDGVRTREVVPMPTMDVANGLPGDTRTLVLLPLPPGIDPGEWNYSSRTYTECLLGGLLGNPAPVVSPDVTVVVE